MKNKMSYEEAVEQLKILTWIQHGMKKIRPTDVKNQRVIRENVRVRRREINYLLSVIAAHKATRKLYAENLNLRGVIELILNNDEVYPSGVKDEK